MGVRPPPNKEGFRERSGGHRFLAAPMGRWGPPSSSEPPKNDGIMNPERPFGRGWRKWYKEFWDFCSRAIFVHDAESAIPPNIKNINKVYAAILQHTAASLRAEFTSPHTRVGPAPLVPAGPGRYEADGMILSICQRANVTNDIAIAFVEQWRRDNAPVLLKLRELIAEEPHRNYFS